MKVSIKEISYSSMNVITAIELCNIMGVTVEQYFFESR